MRALVMTAPSEGPDRTEVREVEAPRPGPGEVTIDVTDAGINFLDVMARRGDAGYVSAWPHTPGKEVAGAVREVGEGVSGLVVGQRVAAFTPGAGGLAEVALAPAALTVPIPDAVPSATAAATPLMLTTALLLLTDAARFSPGETVLVHSASGGVGGAVARLVPALGGGRLIGTVGRADKVAAAKESGYDVVVSRDGDVAEAIRASGGSVDVVLDPQGTALLETDLAVTAPGGRIVLFGNAGGGQAAALPDLQRLRAGNIAVAGFSISSLAVTAPGRVASALRRLLDLVADGRLTVPVTEVGSLAEVPGIHQRLAEGRGAGKYVVRVAGS
ncbi:quinone oxidoreductase family protein [Actinoallomurus rhizosphaericola]|uniref:quinone oxidoreductase family protein n=1 Tax=Actinoallomurus rhizosphaericola TaxID=2952536 RepID=UPI002090BF8E|nr:zinc-binding dehydrogenase [Actinoallomurus rhizosphaericola]MCO5993090.1 zinc-binding dehydrogenase [Actinoallomurus rhizosphaericola]